SVDPEAGPYEQDGSAISLWTHVDHRPVEGVSERFAAVAALRKVYDALASYEGPLPSFERAISYCRELLDDPFALSAAPAGVREFLDAQYRRAYEAIPWSSLQAVPLHGDTHLGNVLMTDRGPIWCDFEGVCLGPLEWDLRCLKATSRASFEPIDPTLLAQLRVLGRVMTTVWCWAEADRSPEIREGAEYHLAVLRRRERLRGGGA
ncbi:MAG: phosphotransferase family protein, partial [Caulobacteraceae bacterium]